MIQLHEPPIIKLCLLWLTLLWKAGKGQHSLQEVRCSRSDLSGSAIGFRNQDFYLLLGKTLRLGRETLFESLSSPSWHKVPRANCQASDLTEMSLGKRDRSERSRRLVFPVCSLSAAFPGPAAAFEPPGKECGGAHVALADCCFLPLRLEFMSGCFLLCLWNAVTSSSAFWWTCSFSRSLFEIP